VSISRWTSACPRVRTPLVGDALAELRPRERPLGHESALDRGNRALGLGGLDAGLRKAPRVAAHEAGCREGVQPGIVLSPDQVKRSSVEPGDDQGPLVSEGAVDVRDGEAGRPRADREPRSTSILGLDGQQALGNRGRPVGGGTREELGGQALGEPGHRPSIHPGLDCPPMKGSCR
jgi:hypothetical protein